MEQSRRDRLRQGVCKLPGISDDAHADALIERADAVTVSWAEQARIENLQRDQPYFVKVYTLIADEASRLLRNVASDTEDDAHENTEETQRARVYTATAAFHEAYTADLRIITAATTLALDDARRTGLIATKQEGAAVDYGEEGFLFAYNAQQAIYTAYIEQVARILAAPNKPSATPRLSNVPVFAPESISFINARPALAAMRAMWAGGKEWQRPEGGQPYFTDKSGVTVYAQEGAHFNPLALDAAWQRVLSLDDSKVSTFLICLGKWMADTGGEAKNLNKTRVHVADILSFRGLKKHVHGGFKREQKEEARDDILALNSIWVRSIEEVRTARGKVEKRAIDSRLLEVAIESNPDLFGGLEPFAFRIAPGDWAEHFLGEHNRQVATLLRPVMRYDPDKQRLPMRLGIYLASLWRNRAHNASYDDAPKIATLLEGAFIALPSNNFDRFRQQIEDALDRLQSDAVIGAWEYVGDTDLPARKWLSVWLEWKVRIVPADAAIERYTKIASRRKQAIAQGKRASKASSARKKTA